MLKRYREAVGETEGMQALLDDLRSLGPGKLGRGSGYVLGCLENLLEQGRAGRGEVPATRRVARPYNPFQPPYKP